MLVFAALSQTYDYLPTIISGFNCFMPKRKRKKANTYWIIPIGNSGAPYQKRISNPLSYQANDIILISKIELAKFKKSENSNTPAFTYEDVLTMHQRVSKKINIEDMGDPFGKAAFSGPEGIEEDEWVVYSGLYADRKDFKGLPMQDHRYMAGLDGTVDVDARNITSVSRYAQHLPDKEDQHIIQALEGPLAIENMPLYKSFFSITLNKVEYTLPFNRLLALEDIDPGKMIGYSYGRGYWWAQQIVPTIFNPYGIPVEMRRLTAFYQSQNGIDSYSFLLNKASEEQFLKDRYFKLNGQTLFILPKCVKQLSQGNANGVKLPAVFYIKNENPNGFFNQLLYLSKSGGSEMLMLELDNLMYPSVSSVVTIELLKYLTLRNIHAELIQIHDYVALCVRIIDIAKTDICDVRNLFAVLNAEIEPRAQITLSVLICPPRNGSKLRHETVLKKGFFASNATQEIAPPVDQQSDNRLALAR
jgi:hypothetical protein